MADKSLAKALKRKMGLDEEILTGKQVVRGDISLLMNAPRRMVFEYVCNHPFSHLRDISRKLGMSPQTAKWHLSKLTGGALIAAAARGKMRLFYPASGIIGKKECVVLFLLRKNEVMNTYRFIQNHPKETQGAMSRSLEIYQQKLSLILLSMERAGLIVHEKRGRRKVYCVTNTIINLEEGLWGKSAEYEKWITDVLTGDGVNPHIMESDHETMTIELDIGNNKTAVLVIKKNPIAALMGTKAGAATP